MATDSDRAGLFNLKASFPTKEEKEVFFAAAEKNEIGTLEKILKKFPDAALTWRRSAGEAVISAAGTALRPQTLAFLLKAGADIDDKGTPENTVRTALQTAAYRGNALVLEMLLIAGAKVDVIGKYNETALMNAIEKDHYACVDLLVLAGADPQATGGSYRQTALDKCTSQQMRDVVADAQKRRADFLAGKQQEVKPAFAPPPPPAAAANLAPLVALRSSFPTDEELKAFFESAKGNELRALRKMLEKFPDMALKWRDKYGNAVLSAAGNTMKAETVAFLVAQGADINDCGTDENKTRSALHLAARQGDAERVILLLSLGAKVDLPSPYGDTPLADAVEKDKKACVDLLVLAGADPNLKTDSYRSSALEKCPSDEMRDIIKAAQEKRAHFLAGLPPAERPRFVPHPPVPETSTVKILKRIDLRFKVI